MPNTLSTEDRKFLIELIATSLGATEELLDATSEDHERALELADNFITQSGFDLDDSDCLGFAMRDFIQLRLAECFIQIGLDDVEGGML